MDTLLLFRNYLLTGKEKASPLTVKNYLSDVERFKEWFEQTAASPFAPQACTPLHISGFTKFLETAKYSPATIERHLSSLRRFFKFLTDIRLINENPFDQAPTTNDQRQQDPYNLKDFKNFLYTKGFQPNTIKNYAADIAHFAAWLDKVAQDYDVSQKAKMAKVNEGLIDEYKNRLLTVAGLSPASVNRKLSSLRTYCQWAAEKGMLKENPFMNTVILAIRQLAERPESDSGVAESDSAPQKDEKRNVIQKLLRFFDAILVILLIAPLSAILNQFDTTTKQPVGRYVRKDLLYAPFQKSRSHIIVLSLVSILLFGGFGLLAYKYALPLFLPKGEVLTPSQQAKETEKEPFVFSARLTDRNGQAITEPTLVIFSFYPDAESFKDLLYQEARDVDPDNGGFFTVTLENVSQSLLSSATPVYLGIAIQGDAEMRPRYLISGKETSVGALFDSDGELDFTADSGTFSITGEQVIIKTGEQSDGSIVLWPDGAGKIDVLSPLTNSITGIVEIGDSLLINSSQATSPLVVQVGGVALFSVDGNGTISAHNLTPALHGSYNLGAPLLSWKTIYAQNVIAASSGIQGYWQRNLGAIAPSNITDDLLVGAIASSSAHFRVAGVNGNIKTSGDIEINGGDITGNNGLRITPGSGTGVSIVLANQGDFSVNSGQLYVDTSTGNVGIGTTSPGVALQVVGRVRLDATTGSSTQGLCWSGSVGDAQIEDCSGTPGDYAEMYGTTDGSIEAGDVVGIDKGRQALEVLINGKTGSKAWIQKTDNAYDALVIGIVSTDPHEVIGSTFEDFENPRPVALSGRVPVKVSTENGPIAPGDFLTSSSTPGVAMKATRAGQVVGKALEKFDCSIATLLHGSSENNPTMKQSNNETICQGKILAFVNLSWYDPDLKLSTVADFSLVPVDISEQTPKFTLYDAVGEVVDQVSAYSDGIIGNLEAGTIRTQFAQIGNVTSDTIHVTRELIANVLRVNELRVTDNIVSPLAHVDIVRTNIISPLSSDTVVVDGKLVVKESSPSAIPDNIVFEVGGNASISGQLTTNTLEALTANIEQVRSEQLEVSSATVSGTLRAGKIIAEEIVGLQAQIASLAAQTVSSMKSTTGGTLNLEASDSATLTIDKFFATTGSFLEGLLAIGPAGFGDVSVNGMLAIGSQFIFNDNSINVLGADLKLQPLGQGGVSIADGKVYIDSMGNLIASGSGSFKTVVTEKLSLPEIIQTVSAGGVSLQSNGSVGRATLLAGTYEATIETAFVTAQSLIYITPTSDTQGMNLYIARQVPGESFTVSIADWVKEDITFNWWIIN